MPHCRKKIVTNGTKLNRDVAVRLIQAGINIILVDNFSDSKSLFDRLKSDEELIKQEFPNVKLGFFEKMFVG